MISLLRSLRISTTLTVIHTDHVAFGLLCASLSQHLVRFGVSTTLVGLTFVVVFVSDALFVPLWGFLSDKMDMATPVMVAGKCVQAVAFLFIGLPSLVPALEKELWCVLLGLGLFGAGFGMSTVPSMAQVLKGAKDLGFPDNLATFGLISGIYVCFAFSGSFVGSSTGGLLVEHVGFGYACTLMAGMFLLMFTVAGVVGAVYYTNTAVRRKEYQSL